MPQQVQDEKDVILELVDPLKVDLIGLVDCLRVGYTLGAGWSVRRLVTQFANRSVKG